MKLFVKYKRILICLLIYLVLFALLTSCSRVRRENSVITEFRVLESATDLGIGGATMFEVVQTLRRDHRIPINFEEIPYDKKRDVLTLGEALRKLRALQAAKELGPVDKKRLSFFEEELAIVTRLRELERREGIKETERKFTGLVGSRVQSGPEPLSEEESEYLQKFRQFYDIQKDPAKKVLGNRKKTFKVFEVNIKVTDLLQKLIEADSDYEWLTVGGEKSPVFVIRPKELERRYGKQKVTISSSLHWEVPGLCEDKQWLAELYGSKGYLTTVFKQNSLSPFYGRGGKELESPLAAIFPRKKLALCQEGLKAIDILNMSVGRAGPQYYWTVWGPKNQRTFMINKVALR